MGEDLLTTLGFHSRPEHDEAAPPESPPVKTECSENARPVETTEAILDELDHLKGDPRPTETPGPGPPVMGMLHRSLAARLASSASTAGSVPDVTAMPQPPLVLQSKSRNTALGLAPAGSPLRSARRHFEIPGAVARNVPILALPPLRLRPDDARRGSPREGNMDEVGAFLRETNLSRDMLCQLVAVAQVS